MPEESLAIAQHFMRLVSRGDWSQLELLAEDLVYRPIAEVTEAGEYHGRQGYRRYMEGFLDGWADDLTATPTSFREYGDAVIVRVQLTGHGRASGIDFRGRVFQVLTIRNGEIARIEDFLDRDDALRGAGQ